MGRYRAHRTPLRAPAQRFSREDHGSHRGSPSQIAISGRHRADPAARGLQRLATTDKIAAGPLMTNSAEKPRIAIGADHAAFQMKTRIKEYLESAGYPVDDMGTWSEASVDYPDFAAAVAGRVSARESDFGILACGTGIGMSIAANKVSCVRAALANDRTSARLAREHNDANVLALGARVISEAQALEVVQEFLAGEYAGGRHQARIDKISQIDKERNRHA
jgi:ribose 5-phosphate isomerase B